MEKTTIGGPTIIVCTTFRDFKGTDNDKIQLLFLEYLKRQTYKNWIIAVTLFGEKNVLPTLVREGIPHVARDGDARTDRYSNTEVWMSGIELSKQYPNHILLWTTCDVMLDEDFFEQVVRHTTPGTCGTTYPNIAYRSVGEQKSGTGGRYYWEGGDLFFFSSDVFQNTEVLRTIKEYRNDGWGATEFYLQALGLIFCKNRINLWPAKLSKVDNDRALTDETRAFLSATNDRNAAILRELASSRGLSPNMQTWINRFHSPRPLAFLPMRFLIWFQSHFRIRLLGVRYHLKRLF